MNRQPKLGATYLGDGRCRFCVWAPLVDSLQLRILSDRERIILLERGARGYHQVIAEATPGDLYLYLLDGEKERPDPASKSQPRGVKGPSQVVDPYFGWDYGCWFGIPLRDYVIYELHVGTFTREGTFDAIHGHLDSLKELGITAIELMPVSQFPGERNWGYDGTYPFAIQNSYGGPQALKRLVNLCHRKGFAVILDVVYNHLGPEGNYLWDFAPYFTDRYKTPWGAAVNFDGRYSDEVRHYFIENALYWITDFHFDALRLDAVHAIMDYSASPFLEELGVAVHRRAEELNRRVYTIPESALNDARMIRSRDLKGFGLDAQWNDDFHHALHTILTSESTGYYQDFGRLQDLAKALREGFVYSGQFSPYRGRRHGNSSRDIPSSRFVVFSQNHDQIGNRMKGDRLSQIVSFEKLKLAASVVILSPFVPLFFMGEEYGEPAPFPYFVSHSDVELVEAVRQGRQDEFSAFEWSGEIPDPQDPRTFQSAKLDMELRRHGAHKSLWNYYQELLKLRREVSALAQLDKDCMEVHAEEALKILSVRRWSVTDDTVVVHHFGGDTSNVDFALPTGDWQKRMDSTEERWSGSGSRVPSQVSSDGRVRLTLAPNSSLLLTQQRTM